MNHTSHIGLHPLLFSCILNSEVCNSVMKQCWKNGLKEFQTNNLENFPNNVLNKTTTTNYAFGILDGFVLKIKLTEQLSKIVSPQNPKESNLENSDGYDDINFNLFNPNMSIICELFEEVTSSLIDNRSELENEEGLFIWNIIIKKATEYEVRLELKVLNNNSDLNRSDSNNSSDANIISKRLDKFERLFEKKIYLCKTKLFNCNNIVIFTTIGLFIYHFNENNKSISLNYFYFMDLYIMKDEEQYKDKLQYYKDVFSKPNLPLPNYDSFKSFDKWVSYIVDNKESLLKYGVELFTFAIKEHKLELIEVIYKKCMFYFKKDLKNNKVFLSVITSVMPILNEYYPEYISRYSLETTMIIDSPFYSINRKKNNLHLHSFSLNLQIIDLSFFILIKYSYLLKITLKVTYIFNQIFSKSSKHTLTPMITFMIPYIKFNNYSQNYNWLLKSSPFAETINKEIFKTWDGEALLNFKWNTYGKYYYRVIWLGFITLLVCFTIAVHCDNNNIQKPLLITSILLGFIHLIFEVYQFFYNPIKWFSDPWNWFDIIAYILPIITSIIWLISNEKELESLIAFSCLFLDIKFLLFLRAIESFGIYFEIIISVGKQIISFIVILLIFIISFTHAFYILLSPKSVYSLNEPNFDDSNNPWSTLPKFVQVFSDSTIEKPKIIEPNQFIIQQPDENTNMFIDYKTALFAIYLFLIGDSSALSNWSYKNNPSLSFLFGIEGKDFG
ncbi:hypothetical protein GLOIN_2v378439 [Rhizophagus irregularis DAOM 181602=DAOM 197198]|uniref:Ion transport domain-containing protein n=1 Tax=Rhizophagus irregularis (strain DAOM 181602 / DAOM 197198 / MUCL 43194) TaxID=747089 RepID=A0A2P4PL00_RHIID|nr:hypothetical protein GLOIN_2v378439 [Rhizophagus irregularis DAOM 181602=DAOM 197198]POG66073.1 hypothetical protein GLOIN_2v378439 [Rhizophagus irregularis DAOM 181602=DAOM 197198]|eukprot:XP_025172939.1 hypothetical protein GLOIN_2v378439 [Rhizophagus irregularis DAOM 181602=DAOM 197198]